MFTEAEKAEIVDVKNRLLKMIDGQYMAPIQTKDGKDIGPVPSEIRQMMKFGILTGGAIASAFHNELPNDFDIYFHREDDIKLVVDYFMRPENTKWIEDLKHDYIQPAVKGKYFTSNAITLVNAIQFIILQTSDLRKGFDFVHCMPWIDLTTGAMHISEDQYRAIKNKKLILNPHGHGPNARRINKYVQRGYKMSDQVKKILEGQTAMSLAQQPPAPEPLADVIADALSKEFQAGMKQALAESYMEALKGMEGWRYEDDIEPDYDKDDARWAAPF